MTDLQRQDFLSTLPGKTVAWSGLVSNISTDGTISLDNPIGSGRVTLKGIPRETAIKIDLGMQVDFTGMIESIQGTYFTDIVITDGKIVRYFASPTATPTPRR
jgi:hypothetical protein